MYEKITAKTIFPDARGLFNEERSGRFNRHAGADSENKLFFQIFNRFVKEKLIADRWNGFILKNLMTFRLLK